MPSSWLFAAVIGDVVGSRHLPSRPAVQAKLERVVALINERFTDDIASAFLITLGDEFQGLLRSVGRLLDLTYAAELELYPVRIRFGVGIGRLDTSLREVALGMDGPAFHRAREALEVAKKRHLPLVFRSEDPVANAIVTDCYALAARVRAVWTPKQREVAHLLLNERLQKAIAARLNVEPAAISQRLAGAMWHELESSRMSLQLFLGSWFTPQKPEDEAGGERGEPCGLGAVLVDPRGDTG